MFGLQTQLVFPTHAVPRPGPLPPGSQRLTIATPDGETLHGVYIAPHARGRERILVLTFAGNAWNSQDAAVSISQLYPAADVIAFHYRGYRPSTGTPSAKALIADAPLVFDAAIGQAQPDKVVAVGLSIGSGVAAELATRRKLNGLILVTAFDSLRAVAGGHYPMIPGMFFEHELNSAAALRRSDVPVALISGENDTLIPPARTAALREAIRNLAFDRTIARAGHNDIYARPEFAGAMREALATLAG